MRITFYGAAGNVTGSKHLVEAAGKRILLDCGTFQGLADVRERNRSLPFPPDSIDAVVISHAHLDHIGMLTLLVKRGFTGKIYATPATRDVTELMLLDAAHIEMQDAFYRAKHHIGAPDEREPLFTPDDVAPVMQQFETIPYARTGVDWSPIMPKIGLKFYDAGHILGSAVSVLKIEEQETHYLAYTGDLGQYNWPLLRDPETPAEPVNTLIMESTYGSRHHEPLPQAIDKLRQTILRGYEKKARILMPSFALGRTQGLVYVLHQLTDSKQIPRLPIFVDSPLATNVTEVFRRYVQDYDERARSFLDRGDQPLFFRNLTYTHSVEESKALNEVPGPCLIIASSGMMTAGRVVHHLKRILPDKRNMVFITGYQAEGTTGRQILEGQPEVELHNELIPVRAEIILLNEFSAHADQSQLIDYAERMKELKRILLVHGEPHQADDLKQEFQQRHPDWQIVRPQEGYRLSV